MNRPTIVSTGLICLDAIRLDSMLDYALVTGGSCINPLLVLQEWGWRCLPVGKIGTDAASDSILQDIARWEMDTRFILRDASVQTPVYAQTVGADGHTFHRRCLQCDAPFSTCTPLSVDEMEGVIQSLPERIDVCLVERLSEAALRLARHCRERGALVMFEPNRLDERLLPEMLAASDIVKYSREKQPRLDEATAGFGLLLEIKTQDADGLRFRRKNGGGMGDWKSLPAVACPDFIDAAGAGDWMTASLLDQLCGGSKMDAGALGDDEIEQIIVEAQQWSANNCAFVGARGMMYQSVAMLTGGGFCINCADQVIR